MIFLKFYVWTVTEKRQSPVRGPAFFQLIQRTQIFLPNISKLCLYTALNFAGGF